MKAACPHFATLQQMFALSNFYSLFMKTACNYSSAATETGRHLCAAMTALGALMCVW